MSRNFREIIRPPLWLMAFISFLFASLVLAIWAALDSQATLISASVLIALLILIYFTASYEIRVDGEELRVGRAHIERKFLADPKVISKRDFLPMRTRNADPAAYHALIFWVSEGVRVEINDPRDSTPYWLISTRRGEELVKALMS